jgi:hypothetical protein
MWSTNRAGSNDCDCDIALDSAKRRGLARQMAKRRSQLTRKPLKPKTFSELYAFLSLPLLVQRGTTLVVPIPPTKSAHPRWTGVPVRHHPLVMGKRLTAVFVQNAQRIHDVVPTNDISGIVHA